MIRKLLFLSVLLALLVACTPEKVVVVVTATPIAASATPNPTATAAPTDEPTPTPEPADWVGLPFNPDSRLEGVNVDGTPNFQDIVSSGNPVVHVEWPLGFDLYGVPIVRWPTIYRRDSGSDVFYEFNISNLSGTWGWGQFEPPCPSRCLIAVRLSSASLHTSTWTPGAISFSVDVWPTRSVNGICNPTTLTQQSPPAPIFASEWSAVWMIETGDTSWYLRWNANVPWAIFGDDSVFNVTAVEVMEVGPGYTGTPTKVECAP